MPIKIVDLILLSFAMGAIKDRLVMLCCLTVEFSLSLSSPKHPAKNYTIPTHLIYIYLRFGQKNCCCEYILILSLL